MHRSEAIAGIKPKAAQLDPGLVATDRVHGGEPERVRPASRRFDCRDGYHAGDCRAFFRSQFGLVATQPDRADSPIGRSGPRHNQSTSRPANEASVGSAPGSRARQSRARSRVDCAGPSMQRLSITPAVVG